MLKVQIPFSYVIWMLSPADNAVPFFDHSILGSLPIVVHVNFNGSPSLISTGDRLPEKDGATTSTFGSGSLHCPSLLSDVPQAKTLLQATRDFTSSLLDWGSQISSITVFSDLLVVLVVDDDDDEV